jgi:signal transduction histidine kinase
VTPGDDAEPVERLRILAHELRSPVAALTALAEAAPGASSADERRRLVALAIAAVRDIVRLLTDPEILSLRRERVDVAELASTLAGPDVQVRTDGEALVEADPTRLRQVLSNLVVNGLRHGSRVAIDVGESEGRVVVDVSDDGPGVARGLDPFARGSGAAGSTGYGLWLARAVAEAHGGSLDLLADGAPGARFRLALPLASGGR